MADKEIIINNRLDPITTLYHNVVKIGKIRNCTALDNVLAQIKLKYDSGEDTTGYYVIWKRQKIDIERFGRILNSPIGFYDSIDESLDIIFGI